MVRLHTSKGVIALELDEAKAPETVRNFLAYVQSGHYSNTVFHRVINGFMIQGGGYPKSMYQGDMGRKENFPPIELESRNGLRNDTGWIATGSG